MKLNQRQLETKEKIIKIAEAIGLNPSWALAIAMTESSLGEKQKSPTGCRGVFQMSSIAMKDLLIEMEKADDDIIDIACGLAFLHLLFQFYIKTKKTMMLQQTLASMNLKANMKQKIAKLIRKL